MDFKTWPDWLMKEFVDLYRLLPCLHDKKSEHFYNRAEKHKSYNLLLEKVRKIDPKIKKKQLVKIVNNMKALYNLVLRKISSCSAKGQEYKRSLAHFDLISQMCLNYDEDCTIMEQTIKEEVVVSHIIFILLYWMG